MYVLGVVSDVLPIFFFTCMQIGLFTYHDLISIVKHEFIHGAVRPHASYSHNPAASAIAIKMYGTRQESGLT